MTHMKLIVKETDNGEKRVTGVGRNIQSASGSELYEATEEKLSNIFADADVDELAGTDVSIESVVDDPLSYRDYLILEDGEIVFDESHER